MLNPIGLIKFSVSASNICFCNLTFEILCIERVLAPSFSLLNCLIALKGESFSIPLHVV